MPSGVPRPIESGDVIGVHFPTSIARHPHPGLVIRVFTSEERDRLAAHRGLQPQADDVLCLMLMISHSEPPRGEPAEYIPVDYRLRTRLDHDQDLFVSYRHFDAALIPQQSLVIGTVSEPYLGRMGKDAWSHYRSQFHAVQSFKKGTSFQMPKGLWT